MKSVCRQFILAIEDALDRSLNDPPRHASVCPPCAERWRSARLSREVLSAVPSAPAPDPYFFARLQARLRQPPAMSRLAGLGARTRDWAFASVLFAATLGLFVYNIQRTEVPNADEAMVLDVPHLNPMHPSDSHARPKLSDAMLNLMNP